MRTYLNISDVQRLFRLPCNSGFASNNFAIGSFQLVQHIFRNVSGHVEMLVSSISAWFLEGVSLSTFQTQNEEIVVVKQVVLPDLNFSRQMTPLNLAVSQKIRSTLM